MRMVASGCVGALLVGATLAQVSFSPLRRLAFPDDDAASYRASLLDLDGDGDLDLFSSGFNAPGHRVYDNDGRGRFSPRSNFSGAGLIGLHVVGDVDLDGDLDIVLTASWLENRGAAPLLVHATNMPCVPSAFADLDGDLRGDIVCRGWPGLSNSITIWRAISPSTYVQLGTPPQPSSPVAFELADFDNDGDLDMLIATSPSGNIFFPPIVPGYEMAWRNDGAGVFTDVSSVWLPNATSDRTSDIVVADFDGDGDTDCAFLSGYAPNEEWLFRRNDGTGVLVPWSLPALPGRSFAVHDLDGDGAPDLVRTDRWLKNIGAGLFTEHAIPGPLHELRCVGDVDNDGDIDLVLGGLAASGAGHRLLLDQGGQTFADATQFAYLPVLGLASIEGDVDGDGDLDLLQEFGPLLRNDGGGWFEQEPFPWLSMSGLPAPPFFVDTDGDGDLDVLRLHVSGLSQVMQVYINDGSGTFTNLAPAVPPTPVPGGGGGISIDADGDGAPDFVVGIQFAGSSLFRNVGLGQFVPQPGAFPAMPSYAPIASADFDGDGDVDVLAFNAGWNGQPALAMLVNDGTGRFVDAPQLIVLTSFWPLRVRSLAVFDADGDGDLDVIAGNFGSASYPNNRHALLRNDGTGRLVEDQAALPNMASGSSVAVGDVDGDGAQDILAVTLPLGLRFWRNDGFGMFSDQGGIPVPVLSPLLRVADFDDDGDPDVLFADRLWVNRRWHLEAPQLPRLGCSYSLSIGGFASQPAVALPFFGNAVRIPVPPFGTIGVDPATAIPLAPVAMTNGSGEYMTSIPADPGLLGLQFSVQAVLVAANGVHLTPSKRETIFN